MQDTRNAETISTSPPEGVEVEMAAFLVARRLLILVWQSARKRRRNGAFCAPFPRHFPKDRSRVQKKIIKIKEFQPEGLEFPPFGWELLICLDI